MTKKGSSATAGWQRRLVVAFVLTAIIPLLTLLYFLASYVTPYVVTVENVTLVVVLNIVLAIAGFVLLMKELEKTTAALREKVAQLESFINSIPDIAWVTDTESRFVMVNKAFCVSTGTEAVALLSHDYSACFGSEEAVKFREGDKQVLEGREQIVTLGTMKKADGRTIYLETKKSPILDDSGCVMGIIGIARDVTESRETEQKLRQANMGLSEALEELKRVQQAMVAQERMNALGQIASGIAHDFNNLLVPIVGFSQLLLEQPEMLEDKEDFVATVTSIHTAGIDAKKIVQRLRQFYKPSVDGEHVCVDIAEVAKSAVSLTQPKWRDEMTAQGARIEVVTEIQSVPWVYGSETELREALINLILNSIDAMPGGGRIKVAVFPEGQSAVVEVSDNGRGMSQYVLSRCIEPFFTTKGSRGTGMGLSSVHGIVERHRGIVTVESEEGKGTTVRIRLPTDEPAQVDGEAAADTGKPDSNLHVLVIDDVPDARTIVSRFLKADGHTVQVAEGGKEGIALCEKGNFDLVITDRAMRDMSGDDVAAAIKLMHPGIPVILLTGFADIMKRKKEKVSSVDTVIGKPITREELQQAILLVADKIETYKKRTAAK